MSRSTGALSLPLTLRHITVGSHKPNQTTPGPVFYFQTLRLVDDSHTIDITVTTTNPENPFLVDYFTVTTAAGGGGSGVNTTSSVPSPTRTSSSGSAVRTDSTWKIAGGVVGGIVGLIILGIAVWYFRRRRSRGGQAHDHSEASTPDDDFPKCP